MTVIFGNPGLIPIEAFTTFGVSAKVTDNPIGEFGTGLKMATAAILRLGGTIRLFRDEQEYEFYTRTNTFRDVDFNFCQMRKRRWPARWRSTQLPYTTQLAKKWEAWQAVREIESNVRDERGWSRIVSELDAESATLLAMSAGSTIVAVDCADFEEAYSNLDSIFLNTQGRTLLEETPVLQVWSGGSSHIWYRGLRVTDLDVPSILTYNFLTGVDLTEDRTSKYPTWDSGRVRDTLSLSSNPAITEMVLGLGEGDSYEASMNWEQACEYSMKQPALLAPLALAITQGRTLAPRLMSLHTRYSPPAPVVDLDTMVKVDMSIGDWLRVYNTLTEADPREKIHAALREAGWDGAVGEDEYE